ncbi:MAG: type II toxin-antitoxin system PemK/MazF family toxin [Dehalococcoidia bacterium]|nr:type II toxin-antitoxin system PemK/MazF family toxin [Dehalococcoidia bacterium]
MTRRGEIYWLELEGGAGSEQSGRRPVLIVQNDVGNHFSPTTVVAAITSQLRKQPYPFHVAFSAAESGRRLSGTVLCEQIRTIDLSRQVAKAGAVPRDKM